MYFAVGFWDGPLQCQHSPIFPTTESWLCWGLPAWLCWSQLLLAACTHDLKFMGFLYLLFLSETGACDFFGSFYFHCLVALFPREAERFRIGLPPYSSRIIINIIIFVIVKIWRIFSLKSGKEWTFHVEIWDSLQDGFLGKIYSPLVTFQDVLWT